MGSYIMRRPQISQNFVAFSVYMNFNLNLHSFPPRNRLVLRKICWFHRYAFLWEDKLDHSFWNQFTNWYDSWISFCLSLPYMGYENSAALLCPSFDTRHWFISIQNQDQSYFGGHDSERNFTTQLRRTK